MKRLVELASRHDLRPFEDAWIEALATDTSDVHGLLDAITALESQGQFHKAASYTALLLPSYIDDENRDEEALLVLKRLAKLSPRDKNLRQNLLKVYRRRHADNPGLDALVRHSRIESDIEIAKAVERLESYLAYTPGSYVEHPAGWGVGIVTAVNAEDATVTIDFAELKGHELEMDMAATITRPIGNDDFRALKFDRIETLRDMVTSDPVALVKSVVQSRERKTAVRDLRERLTDGIIPTKDWSKWWTKTRAKVKRDPNVKMSTGNNPSIEVTKVEQSFEDTTLNNMGALKTLPQKIKYVRELFNELDAHPETRPALVVAAGVLAKSASEGKKKHPGATFSLALMLEKVAEVDSSYQIPDELRVDMLLEDPFDVLSKLDTVPIAADRKELLGRLRDRFPEAWLDVLDKALYLGESDVNDFVMKELIALGAFDRLTRAIFEFQKKFRDHRTGFLWLVKTTLKGNLHQALPHPGLTSLLEKTLLLHSHCTNKFLQSDDAQLRKEFRSIEKLLVVRNCDFFRRTIDECSVDEALDFYNMVRGSRSLPDDVKDAVVAAILRTRPEVAKRRADAEEQERGADDVVIDERVIYVTSQGYERYEDEFNKLVNDEIPKNAAEIGLAASHGDLSENAEWSAALEKQGILTQRAEEMREALERARIIDESMVSNDTVAVGCQVKLRNVDSGGVEQYTLLGPWDVDTEQHIISYLAPLGRSLLGKTVGALAEVTLPGGTSRYEIEEISVAPRVVGRS